MSNSLNEIIKYKQLEIERLKKIVADEPASQLVKIYSRQIKQQPKNSFRNALSSGHAVIAEIKRKSPSKNQLAEINDPTLLAKKYIKGGAAAISVLTDPWGFSGSIDDLNKVSKSIQSTPVLRKDFILDSVQIAEAILNGADAILLIVAILKEKTKELLNAAKEYGIDVLVEVHNRDELDYAISIGAEIIGVNNRNLSTFEIDINNAKNLIPHIPSNVISVAESGIEDPDMAKAYFQAGFNAVLIGEALVKAPDPEAFIKKAICNYRPKALGSTSLG